MLRRRLTRIISPFLVAFVVAAFLATGFGGRVTSAVLAATQASVLQKGATEGAVIHYQGRLLEPTTGQAKPDGAYTMSFSLYTAATGGGPLWTENKSVAVDKGLFSTLLGDITPFSLDIFNGQPLYLGITVGSDPEATPRQQIAHVAYAFFAATAASANTLNGQDSTAFAAAAHTHDGADIVSGTILEPLIDSAITRDDEVMPIVKASGGTGSGIDADKVDGLDSTAFLRGGSGVQVGNASLASGGQVTWTSFGWSPSSLVLWWVVPKTDGGKLSVTVESELQAGQGTIRYWITVRNTGTIATNYDLMRTVISP